MTCMYPPPHLNICNLLLMRHTCTVSSSSYDMHVSSSSGLCRHHATAHLFSHMTCMYPPPHMTCMYPPPYLQVFAGITLPPTSFPRGDQHYADTGTLHASSSSYDMHVSSSSDQHYADTGSLHASSSSYDMHVSSSSDQHYADTGTLHVIMYPVSFNSGSGGVIVAPS